jgi:hypothetical protein|tara:strand:- start:237 stop:458 length:222 start_codon:yes stop_codon:yes gene_type:complete
MDKDITTINALADKLLAVVMNSEMEDPTAAIAALGHIAAMISIEMTMSEPEFLMCMASSYRTIVLANKDQEVH